MKIKTTKFIKGVIGNDYSMGDALPQIIFLGRSNVGKSSVINTLLARNNLAKSSSTPGKTREANFFLINNSVYFVDFPGYGYAKTSYLKRNKLIKRILWYLQYCKTKPMLVMLILDTKVGLTKLDKEIFSILKKQKHKRLIIANKSDKLKQQDLHRSLKEINKNMEEEQILPFSARTKLGRDNVLQIIWELIVNR